MKRRHFITLLGGAAAAWALAARAQQPVGRTGKMPRVGMLMPGPAAHSAATLDPFYRGLHELGYIEGQNLAIERRDGDWKPDRLPALAAELVGLKVDIIVAWSTPTARAAKQATNSIPIIAAVMADPVGDELVASLARPGGNVTGSTFLGPELVAKRLQLLRDVVPGLARVAALWHPHAYGEHTMASVVKDIEEAARTLGMQLQLVPADGPDDIASAFSTMAKERADAFIVLPSPMLFGEHRRIVELAANNRLPGMYQAREFVDAGGLMSYGANLDDLFRRTATYVDKILKGAKPADLPVERPTKFELVINLKASDPYFDVRRERIIGFAERQRLPAIYQFREYAVAGGLLSYGVSITDAYRHNGGAKDSTTQSALSLKGQHHPVGITLRHGAMNPADRGRCNM
jgi:putative tryptophan/tyrosine transport system substrate-binding protein